MSDVAKPKGEKCVAPTDEMRASHFEKILHQRDKTMHQGIRTKTNSLKECITATCRKTQQYVLVTTNIL